MKLPNTIFNIDQYAMRSIRFDLRKNIKDQLQRKLKEFSRKVKFNSCKSRIKMNTTLYTKIVKQSEKELKLVSTTEFKSIFGLKIILIDYYPKGYCNLELHESSDEI